VTRFLPALPDDAAMEICLFHSGLSSVHAICSELFLGATFDLGKKIAVNQAVKLNLCAMMCMYFFVYSVPNKKLSIGLGKYQFATKFWYRLLWRRDLEA
jgi:hypothetical protein